MRLWQAGHSSIQMLFCFAKMLVGLCPNPICSASCRCRLRVCSKHFYNKKDSLGFFHEGRILGYLHLSGLHFFGNALFLCKEHFYVSLCTKKLLHFFDAADFIFLQKNQGLGHLFQIVAFRPPCIAFAFALGELCLNCCPL